MKVDVRALIESIKYVRSAVPYFINSQGITAQEGLEIEKTVNGLIKKLGRFESYFENNLDFHNPELVKYFEMCRAIINKQIESGKKR